MRSLSSEIHFHAASDTTRDAVSAIIARQMGEILARFPLADLGNEAACFDRLAAAGFSSQSIFHLAPEACFQAWSILEPTRANRDAHRRMMMAGGKAVSPADLFGGAV